MRTTKRTAIVTGAAGFIGFHTCKILLEDGWEVTGIDCLSDYYDVDLKKYRERILTGYPHYQSITEKIEKENFLTEIFEKIQPEVVIHLAAQAGVRHSIENPRDYLNSNLVGTFELLEAARSFPPKHILMASTSSSYGANVDVPSTENAKADHQLSFYAATKKSTENLAHSYAHLFKIPITMLRFFTVYGPWGRPDLALFRFVDAIIDNKPIDIFNNGEMFRDFTFIDDLVQSIFLLIDVIPCQKEEIDAKSKDSLSPVAPHRIVNIGNGKKIKLMDFIEEIEKCLGRKAIRNYLPMQMGDVRATMADTSLLKELTGYQPNTSIDHGISEFVRWFQDYYKK